jgi:phage-related protein
MKKNGYGINVKETTFHLRTEMTKNRHLEVATRSSTQWEAPHHTTNVFYCTKATWSVNQFVMRGAGGSMS